MMNWKDILKNAITQGRVKEIEDIDIDIEDDDCKRELQRLANKLKNYKPVVEKRWNTGWHKKYENTGYAKDATLRMDFEPVADGDGKSFYLKIYYGDSVFHFANFFIWYVYKLDDVPESVACRALEMLKEEKSDNENIEINGNYYRIQRTFNKNHLVKQKIMLNGLKVYKNGETVLLLEVIADSAVISSSSRFPVEIPLRQVAKESGIGADLKFADRWHR